MLIKKILSLNIILIFAQLTVIQATEKDENLLSGTLRVIFANIFKPKSMSVSIIVNISGHEDYIWSQEILDDVMHTNKNIQVPVAINQYTAPKLHNFIQAKLIFTNSAENVRIPMENRFQNNEIQSLSTKYLIILKNPHSMRKKLIEMHKIFKDFFDFYIIDVIILIPETDSVFLYTYKPYDIKHCAYTKPLLLHHFEKVPDILSYNDLFPIKTNNFYQCPLKVVLWHTPPFVNITYDKEIAYYTGFDVEILKDLAKFLNFSIEVIPNEPPNLLSGEVFRNYTAIGVFKLLLERKANLSIGFIGCKPRRLQLTTGSMPYFLSEVLIIFKNSQKYSEYYLLFRPFNFETWCFFITVLILKSIFKRIVYRNFKLHQSFRNILELKWIFLIFLLRLTYEGSIFQVIRKSPYKPLPLTLDELIQQNYSLITDYVTARLLREIAVLEKIITIVPGNPQNVLESIDDLDPNTGILSWDTIVAQFMKTRLSNYSDYAIVRDKVSNAMCCIFFPRLSFMAPSVNFLLNEYKMFGIFNKYNKQLGFEYLPTTTDQLKKRFRWSSKVPLDLSLLMAVFRYFAVMNIVAVLVFLLEILSSKSLATAIQTAVKEENLLSGTLKVIFANIFKPKSVSVSVIVNISGYEDFKISQDILDNVLSLNNDIQVPVAINQYTASKLVNIIQAKIIFTNSARSLRDLIENFYYENDFQSVSTKYLIVLNNQNAMRQKLIEMHTIFKDFFNFYIIDVVILVSIADSLHIYTYKPYNSKHCALTSPILLQRFDKVPDVLSHHDLFPIKTNNFYQCPMKVVLWNIPPFMNLTHKNRSVYLKGFDAKILKNLAYFLNFSIKIIPNEPRDFIGGEVFENDTATGVFKMLIERKANFTIGYISCKSRRLQLTTGTLPYFLSEILIIFKNSQKYTPFELLLRPFNTSTWSFFITTLILKPLFARIFKKSIKIPQSFRKLLRLQWLLLIFLLRTSYEGSIFQAIRKSPYQTLPLTIDEVVQQNYSLIADYASARILNEITDLKNITTIVPGDPYNVLKSIDDLPLNTGILTSDIFIARFMQTRLRNYSDYAIVREKVSNTLCCAFFPRLSFMAPGISFLLKQQAMYGIFQKYSKEFGFEYLPMTTDKLKNRFSWNSEAPLDVSILKAVFRSFGIMSFVSVLVFVLEILSFHCRNLRRMFSKIFGC